MRRSSSVPRLHGLPDREMVVIRLPVERRRRGLRARLYGARLHGARASEAGVVLVTLALIALLFVCLRRAVDPPTFSAWPPPGTFVMPVAP